jgi:hypothetical protein
MTSPPPSLFFPPTPSKEKKGKIRGRKNSIRNIYKKKFYFYKKVPPLLLPCIVFHIPFFSTRKNLPPLQKGANN